MNDDDRIDRRLAELADGYHRPPPVPRAEMWSAIRSARQWRMPHRPTRRHAWLTVAVGMAATFVLGVLVGGGVTAPGEPAAGEVRAAEMVDHETGRHLARVEVLLRATRAELDGGSIPTGAPETARVLLAENRFLTDLPPETRLPEVASLLEDIELVLAQIAVLENGVDPEELYLLEEGIERRDVLSRLYRLAVNT